MASTGATSAPGPSAILKLILLGAIVGIPAAFVAWLFLGLVHVLEELLWTDIPDALDRDLPPWWLVLLLPVLGALVVYVARRFLPGDGGHRPLQGIGGPPMPWQHAPSVALAAIGTLAFGAVLGPEAPLIALGSVVGMFVAQQAKLQGPAQNVVAQAGSFSAVSALFGGPLVAGVLFLEGALGRRDRDGVPPAGVRGGRGRLPALRRARRRGTGSPRARSRCPTSRRTRGPSWSTSCSRWSSACSPPS